MQNIVLSVCACNTSEFYVLHKHLIILGKNSRFQINLQRNSSICFLYCIVVTVQTPAFKVSMPINHCSQHFFHTEKEKNLYCAFSHINQPTNQQHIILLWLVVVSIFSVQYNLGWISHKTVCDECQSAFNSSTNATKPLPQTEPFLQQKSFYIKRHPHIKQKYYQIWFLSNIEIMP